MVQGIAAIKRSVTALVLALGGAAHAEQWTLIPVQDNPTERNYIALSSIIRSGDTLFVPWLLDYVPPLRSGLWGIHQIGSDVFWVRFDCSIPRSQIGPSIEYSQVGARGTIVNISHKWSSTGLWDMSGSRADSVRSARAMACSWTGKQGEPVAQAEQLSPDEIRAHILDVSAEGD